MTTHTVSDSFGYESSGEDYDLVMGSPYAPLVINQLTAPEMVRFVKWALWALRENKAGTDHARRVFPSLKEVSSDRVQETIGCVYMCFAVGSDGGFYRRDGNPVVTWRERDAKA